MNQIKLKLFYFMTFLVFTQGMWERIFFFSPVIQYFVDVVILAFLLFQFNYNLKAPGSTTFLVLCLIGFFIGYSNGDAFLEVFLYLRFVIYTYLIYNQLYSNVLNERKWTKLFRFFVLMVFLQGIGALFNIFILQDRVEGYVGLMSSLGGTTATVFPLLLSTLVLVFFLFKRNLNKRMVIILGLILFSGFLVGYSSGKRGIYFIIPFISFIVIVISFFKLRKSGFLKKKLFALSILGLFLFPLMIYGMVNSRGLNYALTGNESSFQILSNSFDYAEEYESSTDQYGNTIGRSNTSKVILANIFSDPQLFFFGEGYGATKEESTMLKLGYGYGIVGFTRDLVSGGFFLSFLTILLLLLIILRNKSLHFEFASTVRFSIVLVFLYTHLYYSSDFSVSLKINLILISLMALLNSPKNEVALGYFLEKDKFL